MKKDLNLDAPLMTNRARINTKKLTCSHCKCITGYLIKGYCQNCYEKSIKTKKFNKNICLNK